MSTNEYGESFTNRRATTALESVNFVSSYIKGTNDEIESLIKKLKDVVNPLNEEYQKIESVLLKLSEFKDVLGKRRNELRRHISQRLDYVPLSFGEPPEMIKAIISKEGMKALYAQNQTRWLSKKLRQLEALVKESEDLLKSAGVTDSNFSKRIREDINELATEDSEDDSMEQHERVSVSGNEEVEILSSATGTRDFVENEVFDLEGGDAFAILVGEIGESGKIEAGMLLIGQIVEDDEEEIFTEPQEGAVIEQSPAQ